MSRMPGLIDDIEKAVEYEKKLKKRVKKLEKEIRKMKYRKE